MTAIAILARAPLPGQAKTRLIPLLGELGAAELQRWLLRRTLLTTVGAGLGPVTLWCAPDATHPEFEHCARSFSISLRVQDKGDLGARMLAAACSAMNPAGVLIVGTDCPALRPAHLVEAAARLRDGDDAVLSRAEEGGYVLMGLRVAEPAVFEGVAWGGAGVLAQTRQRLGSAGLRWSELPTLWDIDRPEDFLRLKTREPELARLAGLP